ncbi:MAG: rod shape-determining protein MreC [Acetobacteraceae bacterium]|jgi:rod shape-determining protein MreC
MIRISIQARQALAKLMLPVLIVATFGLMLLGKADAVLAERARMVLADALAPIYAALSGPLATVRNTAASVAGLWDVSAENTVLREENEQLRRWQSIALALDAENQRLKADLHWVPDPAPSYVTARVVADAGGLYAKAVLLSVGPNHGIRKGEIVLDERGLVGRVTEVGVRSARVLLITDMNSRVPVVLENSGAHAIVIGTNGSRPRVVYWPEGSMPQEGERVVTSTEAGAFPANLPVGTVHFSTAKVPEVMPAAMLDRLEVVRVFDYGLTDIAAPEAPGRLPERRGR